MATDPDQTSPMSAWLIGLFLGAINSITMFELGVLGAAFAALCVGLFGWKGPRLPAFAGFVIGIGVVWTVLFANSLVSCGNSPTGSSCDPGALVPWVAGAAGVLALGVVGTVLAARRLRVPGRQAR